MSRKRFIVGLGGNCSNWSWSWSFVNHDERRIFFGAWQDHIEAKRALIFSEDWRTNNRGHKQKAWPESREHLRLIEQDGFELFVYPMICANLEEIGVGPRKIEEIVEEIFPVDLVRKGRDWFAVFQD